MYTVECPAEFRDTEFRRNFAEFFPGFPPEKSYGIPYCLRNSVRIRNSAIRNSVEFRIPRNSVKIAEFRKNTEFLSCSWFTPIL